ncbi:Phosphoribosylformylglycinamidine cyclo-ligase [Pyrolobus fumarii 1A]|uniref:phosphoribosylformylglycinamidine cyclo-ligase n=1 Tax=Pyrolobus fumarii (strain DSM 11204 / 1A) TaxID=694429 RepID=G0EGR9_PYRF1|nr:phosphoribosylformylglycinamidine cyclo-ligase [Pyrolobus fumarii]AEM39217.1 Phosphoribosylformylglycinamidine cyclo-ligase [Pyrolobus fumarii 1A]
MRYRDAGVDLDAHRAMHAVAARVLSGSRGAYTSSMLLDGTEITLHVDGVGTKTLVLEKLGRLDVAGWDCVVMNTNDVACDAFRPVALVDYVALPRSDESLFKPVLEGVARAAERLGIAVLGGETAILPGLAQGVDVVCTVLAVRDKRVENRAGIGDVLYGLPSNGLHANGFSLVRRLIEEKLGGDYHAVIDGVELAEELSKPVADYTGFLLEAWREGVITAAAHITGGAYTKLSRILPEGARAVLDMPRSPPIFELLLKLGVPVDEAYRVFNMGFGLVVAARPDPGVEDTLAMIAEKHGFSLVKLGRVEASEQREVVIRSPYVGEPLVYRV